MLADAHPELEGQTAGDLSVRDDSSPVNGGCCGTDTHADAQADSQPASSCCAC